MELTWDSREHAEDRRDDVAQHNSNHQYRVSAQSRSRPAKLTVDNCDNVICFLDDFGVLVCKEHRTAIINVDKHLLQHHALPAAVRRPLVEHYSQYETVDPKSVKLPEQPADPIDALGPPLDGLQCKTCSHITTNSDKIRIHCKKEHEQAWTGDKSLLYTIVKVQSFFRTGGLQKYFVVELDEVQDAETTGDDRRLEGRLVEFKLTQELINQELQVLEDAAKTDRTGWYKRTGWIGFFKDRNLTLLAHQLRTPEPSERKIKLAAELTEYLIERCVKGLATLPQEIRRWLRSAKREEPDTRPLGRLQNPESQARYAGYIVKFVCFYLRIIADEEGRILSSQQEQLAEHSDSENETSSLAEDSIEERDIDSDGSTLPRRPRKQRKTTLQDPMKDARELFTWTPEQKTLAIRLWDVLDGGERIVQMEALLESLATFIFVKYPREPLSCGFVQFLAVLGIDREMGRLRTGKNYSFMLAGVVYCVRVLGIEKLLPAGGRDEQTEEDRERFMEKRENYLADGSFSPMSEMINLLAMGKHIGLNAGNSGNAYWSKDKKIYYLHGRPIVISRFCEMAQGLVADTTEMLWALCWVEHVRGRFTVDLGRVVDDVTFTKRGMSFVDSPSNKLSDGLRWMLKQADNTEGGRRLQRRDRQWDTKAVRRYLEQVDRFLEMLLCSVHVTSGQPGRGSEITTMRHRNGTLQDRNIFVADGQIMTVVRYHKSQSQWDKPKVVPRFLPPQLGQVMAMYLVYIQPFREYLTLQVLQGKYSDYVWSDAQGAWETDRLTRVLKRETANRLGVKLHTLDYRHTAVGIGREKVGQAFSKGYDDDVGEMEEEEVDDTGEDIVELQNSRTTSMGIGNYAVPIDIVKHLSVRSIDAFRPLSMLWHKFLGIDGKTGGRQQEKRVEERDSARKKRARYSIFETTVRPREKEVRVETTTRENDVCKAMQRIFKTQNVGFRSVEQELAVHAALDKQTPLVVVLPTGGGKSLLFMVPGCVEEGGMTVVVVPYRALIADLVARIRGSGIECIEWKYGETNPASIVVVSADIAGDISGDGNFLSYATLLCNNGVLRRVVVDECHLIYTSSDWRPKLAELKNLRLLPCPIVLLTATLPPVREHELASAMLLTHVTYVRASTVRRNTQYFVSWCQRDKLEETAITICRRRQRELLAKGQKGVVYCGSKQQTEAMAETLGCIYYHASMADRAQGLAEWMEKGGLIIATSALGTGVDIVGVVYILHVGMPWSMTDFAQESGRGGREGETVDAVILVAHGEVERRVQQKSEDIDVQAMGAFITGSGCRRALMSGYLDGKGVTCSDIGAAGCDRCGDGAKKWLEEQERQSREWQIVREKMDELHRGCAICWLMSKVEDRIDEDVYMRHRTMQCVQDEQINTKVVDKFRREVRGGKESHSCFQCWVSQKFCATGEGLEKSCQWPNIVIPVARTALLIEAGQRIVEELGFTLRRGYDEAEFASEEEYARWLGLRHKERV